MPGKIVVLGSINMDLVVQSPRLPERGETLLGGSFATFPGGKGANQAVAAARLGAAVAMIGRVGADGFGADLLAGLARDKIDTACIQRDPRQPTGIALITVDNQGDNTIVVASGANMQLTPADATAGQSLIADADLLVLQLEVPPETSQVAAGLARRHGAKVVLNPAPAQTLDPALLSQVDYLIPNEGELLRLTGETQFPAAIRKARGLGVGTLIVTQGAQGALLIDAHGEQRIPAFRVTPVDSVAAGDGFVGAFAVGISEGKSTLEAIRFACAAAAISVTRKGAQPSLPTRQEVEQFLTDHPSG